MNLRETDFNPCGNPTIFFLNCEALSCLFLKAFEKLKKEQARTQELFPLDGRGNGRGGKRTEAVERVFIALGISGE